MSEHTCTCCGTELPFGAPVTVIASAYVADWGEIVECDFPNQETLCENCAGQLDALLRDLHEKGDHNYDSPTHPL